MKGNMLYIVVVFTALWLGICKSPAQDHLYEGNITVELVRLEQRGEMLHVSMDIMINHIKMKSAHGIDLIPRLIAPDMELNLPKVSIKGNSEYMAYERAVSLMPRKMRKAYQRPYFIGKNRKRESYTIRYRYMLSYEPWMAHAKLDMQRDNCGCGITDLMDVENVADRVVLEKEALITPYITYVRPAVEAKKYREIEIEVFLDFAVNKTDIKPNYMNNPRELARIRAMIDELRADPNIEINRLDIIGYASPEGPLENNKRLSEGRAMALRDYLEAMYWFPRELYHVILGGENWDGLVQALADEDMEFKYEVKQIIKYNSIEAELEAKLKRFEGGRPYRYMLDNIFPSLRVAVCKASYDVRNFDVDEAKEIIRTRPQNLSLNEMFLVANTYPKGSPEFIDVFETAVRMFPEDETANLNAAVSALSRNDIASAEHYLNRVKSITHLPEYNNAMGVLSLLKKEYRKAKSYLEKAFNAGLEEASFNLELIVNNNEKQY